MTINLTQITNTILLFLISIIVKILKMLTQNWYTIPLLILVIVANVNGYNHKKEDMEAIRSVQASIVEIAKSTPDNTLQLKQVKQMSTEWDNESIAKKPVITAKIDAPDTDIKVSADVELVKPKAVIPKAIKEELPTGSKYLKTWFGKKTGQMHLDQCKTTEAGRKFLEAFAEYGIDNQLIACATLNNENGTHDLFTRGVCNEKYQEGGDYRRCVYADINSAGLDLGLFQINSYYQATRITKLAGQEYACKFTNSRDWSDPCNKLKAEWLFDIDNQILIIKDIYNEQGFKPWSAYNSNVKPYL
jgi:hypothetical protein